MDFALIDAIQASLRDVHGFYKTFYGRYKVIVRACGLHVWKILRLRERRLGPRKV